MNTPTISYKRHRFPPQIIAHAVWLYGRDWPIAAANALTLVASMSLIGLTTFLPIYVQVVLRQSTLVAGITLTVMLVGWPVGSTIAARVNNRVEPRRTMLAGSILQPLGASTLILIGPQSSPVLPALASLIMGFGMGLISGIPAPKGMFSAWSMTIFSMAFAMVSFSMTGGRGLSPDLQFRQETSPPPSPSAGRAPTPADLLDGVVDGGGRTRYISSTNVEGFLLCRVSATRRLPPMRRHR